MSSTAAELFVRTFGTAPDVLASAPGRVNLIGDHTDYSLGLALPFAIDARASVAVRPRNDGVLTMVSAQTPDQPVTVAASEQFPGRVSGWAAYVVGAAWALRESGIEVGGADFAMTSDVPMGAGLSSSAAMECAAILAFSTTAGVDLDADRLARLAQRDENEFVGVPCGLLDQMAAAACTPGHALFYDFAASASRQVPFDPAAVDLVVLVVDTHAHHSLADGEYAARRAECERAAAELGLDHLSELTAAGLDAAFAELSDDLLRQRVRHVITENERVRSVAAMLGQGDLAGIGPALSESHRSLRDDFQVSCSELDVAAAAAEAAGALGARMTGGGFGGSVVALVPSAAVDAVGRAVSDAFADHKFGAPSVVSVSPAGGARVDG